MGTVSVVQVAALVLTIAMLLSGAVSAPRL